MKPFAIIPFSRRRRTPKGAIRTGGAAGLARWLARTHPAALKKALAANPQLLGDLGQAAPPATLADKATQLANAVLPFLQLDVQRRLLRTQVKRAEQGLPPLDTSQIDLPAARVEVEAGQATKRSMLGIVAAVLLGALLLFGGRRRRRS